MIAVLSGRGILADRRQLFIIRTNTGSRMSMHANTILVGMGSTVEYVGLDDRILRLSPSSQTGASSFSGVPAKALST